MLGLRDIRSGLDQHAGVLGMRLTAGFLFCILICTGPAFSQGTMSDPAAMAAAKLLYGGVADIGTKRKVATDTYWTRRVGFDSPGCDQDFTVTGEGQNTWDSAIANAQANPPTIGGPFKGQLSIEFTAFSPTTLQTTSLLIDGNPIGSPMVVSAGTSSMLSYTPVFNVDTTTLTNDYHVACAQAVSNAGTGKISHGYLFKVDQTNGASGAMWTPGLGIVPPSVSPAGMMASFLGVTGEDYTGGQTASPNGTPDWHIQLQAVKNVPTHIKITDAAGEWDWPQTSSFYLIHPQFSNGFADLWFEPFMPPPPGPFTVTLTFSDSTTASAVTAQ